jgi:pectate lyase
MMKKYLDYFLSFCLLFSSCSPKLTSASQVNPANDDAPIAFPGAEGFGKYATGGRGGKVMIVTNLNDDGEGSLRKALSAGSKTPVIIVFAISGTIHLQSPLGIYSNTTVAGQSAPGDGICLADHPVVLKGDNVIVRYIRFRMGDRYQDKGKVDGAGGDDAFGGIRRKNIIIDHCTMSWSTDEAFSIYAGDSTTLQWNLISEPLNYSYHFETGDKDFEHHGFGGIWGGVHASFHHNLFAHCNNRTPRFNGIRHTPEENCDYRNNVIYNWGGNNVYAGEGGTYNIVNNYYKPGPDTRPGVKSRVANPYKGKDYPMGKWYIDGNYMDGNTDVTLHNWEGVVINEGTAADLKAARLDKPFTAINIRTQAAYDAYLAVLQSAGASYKRDTLDTRIINDVKNGTGRFIDVQGGFPHGTPYGKTASAWPFLDSLPAPADTDKDGIPDEWETKNGLNPNDAADASQVKQHAYYSNIELYLNALLK